MSLDVLLVVPFEPPTAHMVDPVDRRTAGARLYGPLSLAQLEFEQYLGHKVSLDSTEGRPEFGGETWPPKYEAEGPADTTYGGIQPPRRTLTSVTLASEFERAGLSWRVFDPGVQDLWYWRCRFKEAKVQRPAAVAVCTTFIVCESWLRAMIASIREILPHTKILIGGYYYAVNAKKFLSLDADVFGVGEGENRLARMVKAVRGREPFEGIPGLYVRKPDGNLLHTGPAKQLNMNEVIPPDWSLAGRIEPYVNLKEISVGTWVETQRGCLFKCEFCDYRTIQSPSALTSCNAVDAIFNAAASPKGVIRIIDATATFPRERWKALMQGLIDRGGSPLPLWCFARVNDLCVRATHLMGKAGVQHVFVGQESGDQRVLNEMSKGTSVKHVWPAVENLARNGINATFSFIHGFPGEDEESAKNTRRMICDINNGFENKPVVLLYIAQPLVMYEMSTVGQRQDMQAGDHRLDFSAGNFTPRRTMDEILETIMAVSRVPHAPVFLKMPGTFISNWEEYYIFSPHRYEIFRWLKAVERGITIFLERSLCGTLPNDVELAAVKETVLRHLPRHSAFARQMVSIKSNISKRIMGRLVREFDAEESASPGLLTRGLVAAMVYRDFRRISDAIWALRQGGYPDIGTHRSAEVLEQGLQFNNNLDGMARKLVNERLRAVQRE